MDADFERYAQQPWEQFERTGQFDWSPAFDPGASFGQVPRVQTFFIMTSSTEETPGSIDAQLERDPQRNQRGR